MREALGSLVSAGLIRKVPGVAGGSFVNSVTPDSLSCDAQRVDGHHHAAGCARHRRAHRDRRVLEVPAAPMGGREPDRPAARRSSRSSSTVSGRRRSTTRTSPSTTATSTSTVAHASGNRLLAALVSAIHDGHPSRSSTSAVTPAVAETTVKQHIAIVRRASAAGTPARPQQAMDEHLEYVLQYSIDTQEGRRHDASARDRCTGCGSSTSRRRTRHPPRPCTSATWARTSSRSSRCAVTTPGDGGRRSSTARPPGSSRSTATSAASASTSAASRRTRPALPAAGDRRRIHREPHSREAREARSGPRGPARAVPPSGDLRLLGLRARRPRRRRCPGYDLIAQARSGMMSVTGDDGVPQRVSTALSDVAAGTVAAFAIAVRARATAAPQG